MRRDVDDGDLSAPAFPAGEVDAPRYLSSGEPAGGDVAEAGDLREPRRARDHVGEARDLGRGAVTRHEIAEAGELAAGQVARDDVGHAGELKAARPLLYDVRDAGELEAAHVARVGVEQAGGLQAADVAGASPQDVEGHLLVFLGEVDALGEVGQESHAEGNREAAEARVHDLIGPGDDLAGRGPPSARSNGLRFLARPSGRRRLA